MENKLNNFESSIKKEAKSRDMYKIVFTDEFGKDIEYEIIATFKHKTNKKIYYIMTDNTRSNNNELNITAYYINYTGNDIEINEVSNDFYPVVDDNELKMVFDVFNKIKDNI
jgi:uncharacterized protein YrzB (UPF0473 family)